MEKHWALSVRPALINALLLVTRSPLASEVIGLPPTPKDEFSACRSEVVDIAQELHTLPSPRANPDTTRGSASATLRELAAAARHGQDRDMPRAARKLVEARSPPFSRHRSLLTICWNPQC